MPSSVLLGEDRLRRNAGGVASVGEEGEPWVKEPFPPSVIGPPGRRHLPPREGDTLRGGWVVLTNGGSAGSLLGLALLLSGDLVVGGA